SPLQTGVRKVPPAIFSGFGSGYTRAASFRKWSRGALAGPAQNAAPSPCPPPSTPQGAACYAPAMTLPTSAATVAPDRAPAPRSGRLMEIALPAAGVVIGMLLILGPFLATVIRSALYWDAAGPALSLKNFVGLFADPRFYQAAGNTILCGVGATAISCV